MIKGDRGGPGSMSMEAGGERGEDTDTARPIKPKEEAVLEAAEAYFREVQNGLSTTDERHASETLLAAVDALLASRQPEGVDPRTLEGGTRFKFVGEVKIYTLCLSPGGYPKYALGPDFRAWEFPESPEPVIPLDKLPEP